MSWIRELGVYFAPVFTAGTVAFILLTQVFPYGKPARILALSYVSFVGISILGFVLIRSYLKDGRFFSRCT